MKIISIIVAMALGSLAISARNSADQSFPVESFRYGESSGQVVNVYCISHGTLAISVSDLMFFIDPVDNYTSLRDKCDDRVVLISHEHGDHLQTAAVNFLDGEGTRIYGNEKSVKQLGKGKVLRNGDEFQAGPVKVKAVPAYNSTPGRENFHPVGNGNGYLFDIEGFVIYVAGDSEPIEEMKSLGNVDVAFLPVNQPYTMTPAQCADAVSMIRPKVLVPYHMSKTDFQEISDAVKNLGVDLRLHEELR